MAEAPEPVLFDEPLAGGFRYTEAPSKSRYGEPILKCCLWKEGEEQPVSLLLLYPLHQRFGATVIETEGFAGVATPPAQRGRGYARRLLERSLERLRDRVSVAFLFGVEQLYDRFGFVTCLDEGSLTLWVRRTESLAVGSPPRLHAISPEELPLVVDLYNRAHVERPWTIARDRERWNRIPKHETWSPGSTVYALYGSGSSSGGGGAGNHGGNLRTEGEPGTGRTLASSTAAGSHRIDGYAVFRDTSYGMPRRHFVVQEMCAADLGAARRMLAAVGRRALRDHVDTVAIEEPEDSLIGMAARDIGCRVTRRTHHSGGGMGVVLDRSRLLESLEGELDRRLRAAHPERPRGQDADPAAGRGAAQTQAYRMLRSGELVGDDKSLLRLLLGYWSIRDLESRGAAIPAEARPALEAWFPGGGTLGLPLPYAHLLDRY